MWMGIAYFAGTLILISIIWGLRLEAPENLLNPWHLLTILRGLIWVLGMAAYNLAIDKIGLTRFNQWKNIQGPVGSLLILLIVTDMLAGIKLFYLLLGTITMFASALIFQIKTVAELKNQSSKKNTCSGIAFALFSGVCFGITALLNSIVSSPAIVGEKFTFTQLLYHSASLIIFSVLVYLMIGNNKKQCLKDIFVLNQKIWLPFSAGTMFLIATLLTIYSYRMIPAAVAWSIVQLNVFWTVLVGVFVFKEVNFRQHWPRLTAGVILAAGALVFLLFAL